MPLLVVGSIAFDSIKTPETSIDDVLGGAAVYFSLAASMFCDVRLVGVVGGDFPRQNIQMLKDRGINIEGLEIVEDGKTFRWSGEYFKNMNQRETRSVELNVFKDFSPKIPDFYRSSEFVFLANAAPQTQLEVLAQMDSPDFVMADTMDLWIQTQREDLLRLLRDLDGIVLNAEEAILLTDARNVIEAGKEILEFGPSRVVIKKGEHGALLFTRNHVVPLPAFPVTEVRDPTGAGDSFAGALMGYLTSQGSVADPAFKTALAYGIVTSSFCVEDFGVRKLLESTRLDFDRRFSQYQELLSLEEG